MGEQAAPPQQHAAPRRHSSVSTGASVDDATHSLRYVLQRARRIMHGHLQAAHSVRSSLPQHSAQDVSQAGCQRQARQQELRLHPHWQRAQVVDELAWSLRAGSHVLRHEGPAANGHPTSGNNVVRAVTDAKVSSERRARFSSAAAREGALVAHNLKANGSSALTEV
jgi:hypothetical protein